MVRFEVYEQALLFVSELDDLLKSGKRILRDRDGKPLFTLPEVIQAVADKRWPVEQVVVTYGWPGCPEGKVQYLAQADYLASWTTLPEQALIFSDLAQAKATCTSRWPVMENEFEYINLGEFRHGAHC